ncbi:HEPN domain-containing protein [Thermus tenuipuniceus]|uniref:HEPN domain-containing protein n=1 Tax=Thermus tenuipuniceus TaxID=2078690 RepID=UPI000CF925F8|nr:HEPN domain-containing protein [Thermus tenuipuniceus]
MSREKRRREGERWPLQAEGGPGASRGLRAAGKHAQVAFMAQQPGARALKGLWSALGLDPRGYSLAWLVKALPGEEGKRPRPPLPLALDKPHIPTRCPDALPGPIPKEAYTREEMEKAPAQTHPAGIREVFHAG